MAYERPPDTFDADELISAVHELRDELRVVRQVIDELREVVDYLSRNPVDDRWRMTGNLPVSSMPADPCADDFGDRLNAVPSEQREAMRQELSGAISHSATAESQRDLF